MGSAKTPEEVSRYFSLKNGIKALFLLDTFSTPQEKIENDSGCVLRNGLPDELGRCGHWREMLCRNRRQVNEQGSR
jgi:hypothetical protein